MFLIILKQKLLFDSRQNFAKEAFGSTATAKSRSASQTGPTIPTFVCI